MKLPVNFQFNVHSERFCFAITGIRHFWAFIATSFLNPSLAKFRLFLDKIPILQH